MPNTILTVQEIAREMLPLLKEELVMPETVNRNYSSEYVGKGSKIIVEKPAVFVADEFGGTINLQDITEREVTVTMDKLADVSFKISAKDFALAMPAFKTKYLRSAVQAIAQKVNQDGLNLYKDIPYFYGVAGTTPDALADFTGPRKVLNDNLAPMGDRFCAWDTSADAKFLELDAIVGADKSGTTQALRDGSIGNIMGFKNYMSQAIKTHTAGTFTAVTTPLTNGSIAAGATTLTLDGGVGTETIVAGDLIQIGTEQFVATANATAADGAISVLVYPAVSAIITDGTAVVFPDKTAKAHVANLAYQRDAFIFVTRPLELPRDKEAYVVTDSESGLSMRVVIGYDQSTKETTMSVDFLYDYVTAYKELACVVLG